MVVYIAVMEPDVLVKLLQQEIMAYAGLEWHTIRKLQVLQIIIIKGMSLIIVIVQNEIIGFLVDC